MPIRPEPRPRPAIRGLTAVWTSVLPAPSLFLVLLGPLLWLGCTEGETAGIDSSRTAPADLDGIATPLRFDDAVFDFGEVFQGEDIRHRYRFVNEGSRPVRIVRVKPTCGCTIPLYTEEPVAPGAEGHVDLVFEAGSLIGELDKRMSVFTDTPNTEPIELVVRGTIRREFWLDPPKTDLGTLWPGVAPEASSIVVAWSNEVELALTEVETTSPSLLITQREPFEEEDRRGERITIELRDWEALLADAGGDRFQQFVVIRTDHPRHPRVTHPVVGRMERPVSVKPSVVNFGVVEAGDRPIRKVRLITRPGLEAAFLGAEAPSYLRLSPVETTSEALTLSIELLPDAPAGSIKESVRIRTGIPSQPEISVYVLANVASD